MLLLFTILLVFILISRIIENFTKIPSTLSIIFLSFVLSYFFPSLINLTDKEFDDILYLMLPVILLPDILNISLDELKKHYKEIIYLALVAVIISIVASIFITPYLLPEYKFTLGMLIALFSMLMATDAITVSSIMSKFKLPERLKIYAESESLFNDVTSLIIFYFIAIPMLNGTSLSLIDINTTLIKVVFISVFLGCIVAFMGYLMIKVLKDSFDQLLVIYLIVIVSFMIAEQLQVAGILSVVTSVLIFKYLVKKELLKDTNNEIKEQNFNFESTLIQLLNKVPSVTKKGFREYKKESEFIGIFANAIVFTILANIIDIMSLLIYYKEILIIFAITTVIRFVFMNAMTLKLKLPSRWARVLTYSGTKGALAIIMVHSLPNNFIYDEMFTSIVIGNVLLSTFVYTFLLMLHIRKNKKKYQNDMSETINEVLSVNKIVDIIKKDKSTKAYKETFIKEIIEDEISRRKRYKLDFSCILIDVTSSKKLDKMNLFLSNLILKKIRTNDKFGRLENGRFIILTVGTSLSGAMILAEKIETIASLETMYDSKTVISFGITQVEEIDTYSTIIEKLDDALIRAKDNRTEGRIEIEI